MQYVVNDSALSAVQSDDATDPIHNLDMGALVKTDTPDARAEFAWRTVVPMMTLSLLMLSLPLSKQTPREPRYGRMLIAVLGFFLYYNLLALCRGQLAKGHWHHATPMWLLSAILFAAAAWQFQKQYSARQAAQGEHSMISLRLKKVDWLIGITVLSSMLLVWFVLVGFDAMREFVRQLGFIGKNGYTLNNAIFYIMVTIPRRIYEMFSFAALIGGLLGLGGLAGTAELTALRAAGMSRLRIAVSAVGVVALLTVGVVFLGETVGPWGDQQAQAIQLMLRSGNLGITNSSGLWARDGDRMINARSSILRTKNGVGVVQLLDVRVFTLTPDGQLARFDLANTAEHIGNEWVLTHVRSTTLDDKGTHSSVTETEHWDSRLDPDVLQQSLIQPQYLSMRDLRRNMHYMEMNGESPGPYASAFWARVLYPLNVLVLVLCTMPFAFGALRSGGLGKRIFMGMLIAIGWYFVQKAMVSFGTVYGVPPLVANLLPALILVAIAWFYFKKNG